MAQIQAKTASHPEPVAVEYDLPEGLDALVAKYGADVVANAAAGAITISLQAFMRRRIDGKDKDGNSTFNPSALQGEVDGWKPDIRSNVVRKSAFDKASDAISSLTAEQKAELLKKLSAM